MAVQCVTQSTKRTLHSLGHLCTLISGILLLSRFMIHIPFPAVLLQSHRRVAEVALGFAVEVGGSVKGLIAVTALKCAWNLETLMLSSRAIPSIFSGLSNCWRSFYTARTIRWA